MKGIKAKLLAYIESLRFPWLLLLTVVLFLLNLLIPDALPFVDEILLALVAALLGRLKSKPSRRSGP